MFNASYACVCSEEDIDADGRILQALEEEGKTRYSRDEAVAFLEKTAIVEREEKRIKDAKKKAKEEEKKAKEEAKKTGKAAGKTKKRKEEEELEEELEEEEPNISITSAGSVTSTTSASSVVSTRSQHQAKPPDPKKRPIKSLGHLIFGLNEVNLGDFVEVQSGQNIDVVRVTKFKDPVGAECVGGIYYRLLGRLMIEIAVEGKEEKREIIGFKDTGTPYYYEKGQLLSKLDPPTSHTYRRVRTVYCFPQIRVEDLEKLEKSNVSYNTKDC